MPWRLLTKKAGSGSGSSTGSSCMDQQIRIRTKKKFHGSATLIIQCTVLRKPCVKSECFGMAGEPGDPDESHQELCGAAGIRGLSRQGRGGALPVLCLAREIHCQRSDHWDIRGRPARDIQIRAGQLCGSVLYPFVSFFFEYFTRRLVNFGKRLQSR